MGDYNYFTVETTTLTIPKSGCIAIYAGEKPRRLEDGRTSYSLRAPLFLVPPDMFHNENEVIEKVAKLLNENAHLFFDSATIDP